MLTAREYADPRRLGARQALYRYRDQPLDLTRTATRLLHDAPGPVLDVGCGPGQYLEALRADRPDRPAIAADLSPGMLAVRRHFASVERIDFAGTIVVPDPEPVMAWLGSMSGPDLTPPVLDEVRARIAAVIARDGTFRFGTHAGFLVCR